MPAESIGGVCNADAVVMRTNALSMLIAYRAAAAAARAATRLNMLTVFTEPAPGAGEAVEPAPEPVPEAAVGTAVLLARRETLPVSISGEGSYSSVVRHIRTRL